MNTQTQQALEATKKTLAECDALMVDLQRKGKELVQRARQTRMKTEDLCRQYGI